ncbi:DUF1684 domain-containing protein [Promicromonospora sp. MEB111]|uniref:DUF1684 domain-containing protein n=1 Tax=unclassified Promicromonospora TaxID=2647929 RepID=UPI00254A9027|nr:DUF1684 domain-containing protein [Promicromonospora sp. MEB111]
MTEALQAATSGTNVAEEAVREHAAWRADRERELREPHGWLSPTALLWPTATPSRLPGVPGEWWVADGVLRTQPVPGDTTVLVGEDIEPDGPTVVGVGEGRGRVVGTFLPEGRDGSAGPDDAKVAVEVIVRTGRYGVRLRDPQAATRTAFAGVPAFDYDPAWVLDVPVRWYDEPEPVTVGAARPGLVHHVEVLGEVDVVHGGRSATLALTGTLTSPTVLFSDEADGVAPWRALQVSTTDVTTTDGTAQDEPAPAPSGTLRLDLNRAVNLPHAFTDFGTGAAPLAGNHLPFAVTAGEKAPR